MNSTTAPNVFQFHDHQVRTILKDGEPWFVATDVARALDYRDAEVAARHLDADEKGVHLLGVPQPKGVSAGDTLVVEQRVVIISESGLYALVLRSRKPEARKFAKWVTSEVLPAIRKTGSYLNDVERQSIEGLCSHMEFLHSWFKRVEPGLRLLNRRLAAGGHDHFVDGSMFARGLVRSLGLRSTQVYAASFPWDGDQHDRDMYRQRAGKALA